MTTQSRTTPSWTGQPSDILRPFAEAVDRMPAAPLIVSRGRTLSYAEVARDVAALAGGLAHRGIGRGDRVGIAVYSGRLGLELYLAAQTLAAQPVLVPWVSLGYVGDLIGDHDIRVLFVGPEARESLDPAAPALCPAVFLGGDDEEDLETLTVGGDELRFVPRPTGTLSAIQFSTGTTGRPKPIVRTVAGDFWDGIDYFAQLSLGAAERWLCPSPRNINVAIGAFRRMLIAGGAVTLMDTFSLEELEAVTVDGITVVPGMAPSWRAVLDSGLGEVLVARGMRTVIATGQRTPRATLERLRSLMGATGRVVNMYGTTEASSITVLSSRSPGYLDPGNVGHASPLMQIEIEAPQGEEFETNGAGEIRVRSLATSPGYAIPGSPWSDDHLFEVDTQDQPWFETGDAGRWNPDGSLTILGRWGDALRLGGRLVFPSLLEHAIAVVPGVRDVAVVSDPQVDGAVAIILEQEADTDVDFTVLAEIPASEGVVGSCFAVEALPRNASDKINRQALAAHLADDTWRRAQRV